MSVAVGHGFLGPFITYDGANIVIICETTFIVSCFFSEKVYFFVFAAKVMKGHE